MVGLVVVSHSRALAQAAVSLAREMVPDSASGALRIEIAAGLDEHTFGTDAAAIAKAITAAYDGDGVVVLTDIGSAVLSADLALELVGDDVRDRVRLSPGPLVEGLLAASVAAAAGASPDEVAAEAVAGLAGKQTQLGEGPAADLAQPPLHDAERTGAAATFTVINRHGLHARPAARLVQELRQFDAGVRVRNLTAGSADVSAASLSRLAMLVARQGHVLEVRASGPDAAVAVDHVLMLAGDAFGETDSDSPDRPASPDWMASLVGAGTAAPPANPHPDSVEGPTRVVSFSTSSGGALSKGTLPPAGTVLHGIPVAPGIGIGAAWPLPTARPDVHDDHAREPCDPVLERQALADAIERTRLDISRVRRRTAAQAGPSEAAIFDAHLALLDDPDLLAVVAERIDQGSAATTAWAAALADTEHAFATIDDSYLRARAADVRAVGDHVLRALVGRRPETGSASGVLVAADLTPAQAIELDPDRVSAVVLAYGSSTSHTAVLVRARGIPAVVDAGPDVLTLPDGAELAVDGATGEVEINPDKARLRELARRARHIEQARTLALRAAAEPAVTRDGVPVAVGANLGSIADARAALTAGADLAGLVRTEFLFLGRQTPPDVDEQVAVYQALAEAMEGRRLTIRTLDVGGDKPLPYLPSPPSDNPFLGVRGLRLSLARPDLFGDQLRAIIRVARQTPVSLMFPMVSALSELIEARRLLDAVVASEGGPAPAGLEVGIMVEVPAVAHKTAAFAPYVDFFSIGTNDLTQYALAAERGNADLVTIADAYDPGVLALIRAVCAGAASAVEPPHVAVCGDLAADPRAAALLVGLGVGTLSVPPPAVPLVKQAVRSADSGHAADLAATALSVSGPREVRALLERE